MSLHYECYQNPITTSRMTRFQQFYDSLTPLEKALLNNKLRRWAEVLRKHNHSKSFNLGEMGIRELFMALVEAKS